MNYIHSNVKFVNELSFYITVFVVVYQKTIQGKTVISSLSDS